MSNWKPVDYVVATLVLTVSFTFMTIIAKGLMYKDAYTDAEGKMLVGIIVACLNIISMYVGAKLQEHRDSKVNSSKTG